MGVLAMLELTGDTSDLLAASREVDRLLPAVPGVVVRIVAPTDDGIVLFQLWDSAEARQRNADDPGHAEALEASGMLAAAREMRSRTFEGAELHYPPGR